MKLNKNTKYCFKDTLEPIFFMELDLRSLLDIHKGDLPASWSPKDDLLWGWIDGTTEFTWITSADMQELLRLGKVVTEDSMSITNIAQTFTINMSQEESEDGEIAAYDMFGPKKSKKSNDDNEVLGIIKVPTTYDPSLVNTDMPIDTIADKLGIALTKEDRPKCISILLDGAPGTGKTMAAAYIAEKLGRKLKSYKLGELLGKYVGESENKLMDAFNDAQEKGYILHFDEIDSIAGDRSSADRTYEVKHVNALLQCMDMYEGIFIATTNSKSSLDTAIKRRFLLKKEFKNVTSEQANKLSKLFFRRKAPIGLPNEMLAPADFALVKNALLFVDDSVITKKYLKTCLLEEAAERNGTNGKNKPIGFVL